MRNGERLLMNENVQQLQKELFLLVGYLLSSAYGLYSEPVGYGPFRLLDASGRLLESMQANGLEDPFLAQLNEIIEQERFGTSDDEQLHQRLNEMVVQYSEELKRKRADALEEEKSQEVVK